MCIEVEYGLQMIEVVWWTGRVWAHFAYSDTKLLLQVVAEACGRQARHEKNHMTQHKTIKNTTNPKIVERDHRNDLQI